MAVIHENFQKLAQRLITKNGRPVQVKRTVQTAPDPAKPWKAGTDPDPEVTTQDAPAVFFDSDDVTKFEDLLVRLTQETGTRDRTSIIAERSWAWIAVLDVPDGIEATDTLVDTNLSQEWKIGNVNLIQPGPTPILYIVEVEV